MTQVIVQCIPCILGAEITDDVPECFEFEEGEMSGAGFEIDIGVASIQDHTQHSI